MERGDQQDAPDVADIWLSNLEEDPFEKYVWHFDMLNHEARHTAYADAFRRLPKSFHAGGPALDLGCGSGLLGLMLNHSGCQLKTLAVEADEALAAVAAKNVRAAGLAGQIEVKACMSTELPTRKGSQRSPLAVHELFDSPLLGEAVLPTMRDAARRLLAPGYFSIPSRVEVWGVLVESSFLRSYQDAPSHLPMPRSWRRDAGGSYPHEVNFFRLEEAQRCRRLTPCFRAFSIDFENLPPESGQHVLCNLPAVADGSADAVVFWWRCAMLRGDEFGDSGNFNEAKSRLSTAKKAQKRGRETLHNEPGNAEDPDHWRQAFCVLPRPAGGPFVRKGEQVAIIASHNDNLIWFRAEPGRTPAPSDTLNRPPTTLDACEPLQPQSNLGCLSDWRLRSLQSRPRCRWLLRQISRLLPEVLTTPEPKPVLDLSAGGIALLLKRQDKLRFGKSSKWSTQQSCRRSRRRLRRLVIVSRKARRRKLRHSARGPLQILCLASRVERRLAQEMMAPLRGSSSALVSIGLKPSSWRPVTSVAALLAEPFDRLVEQRECDLQLWQHWAQVQDLLPCVSNPAMVFPRRFRVHVALLSCARLWQGRQLLKGRLVGGVRVDNMDDLASPRFLPFAQEAEADGRSRFPCELWQQDHFVLRGGGSSAVLCTVDVVTTAMQRSLDFEPCQLAIDVEMLQRVGVHGLATWTEVEAFLPSSSSSASASVSSPSASWSTASFLHTEGSLERFAPGPFKQGTMLARNPRWATKQKANQEKPIGQADHRQQKAVLLEVKGRFDATRGELRLCAKWSDTGLEF